MKKLIIFLFLLFLKGSAVGYIAAASNELTLEGNDEKFDLLRKLARTKTGDVERLKILNELAQAAKDMKTELYYSDKLLKEAEDQKNNEYICQAYYARLVLAYNTMNVKGVNNWFALLEPIARKEKLYDLLFRGRRGVIDMLNVSGDYEREEKEALKMLEEAEELKNDVGVATAYQCLSHAYNSTFRTKEAAVVLEKGYNVAYRIQDMSLILEINNQLIATYKSLGDQTNLLKWTKNLDVYLQQRIKENPSMQAELRGWILLDYLAYLSYYTELGDLAQASIYLKLAEQYNMAGYSTYDNYYHYERYKYFTKAELYEEALLEIDAMINLYRELSLLSYGNMIFQKAKLLERMERRDDALLFYEHSFELVDSIQVVLLNKQTEQLKKDYDTDQLLLKREKMRNDLQTMFLIILIIVVVIVVFFMIHTYVVRARLRKSEEEMRRMANEMEQANIAKERFLSTISIAISGPLNSVVDGSLKLTLDEMADADERKDISRELNQKSAKLLEMINNILDLSRLEAGMMKFKPEMIEILPFIQGLVTLTNSQGKRLDIKIIGEENHWWIEADVLRIQEVFNNLLTSNDTHSVIQLQAVEEEKSIEMRFWGTILASIEKNPVQEIVIANELNRLLIEYFGGRYSVVTEEPTPFVCIVLPLKF